MTTQSFRVTTPIEKTAKYDHGFSDKQVATIKEGKLTLDSRDLTKFPVTLEEFKTIVVPWNRIHRVEQFILHPVKEKTTKVKPIRTPRVKKLTKKAIAEKINSIVFKMATGEEVSTEEKTFYEEQVKASTLI